MANPPYVRMELIKEQKPALKRVYSDIYTGRTDLYVYFYIRALQLLKPSGMLAFISSNKWLRAAYGENLRIHLATKTTLHSLIDFGDLPLFGAIAYPMIIIARRQDVADSYPGPHALTAENLDILADLTSAIHTAPPIPQHLLRPEGWQFVNTETMDLVEKLRISGVPLGEYVDGKFYRGVVTGLNQAFVIDQTTREQLIAEDPRSAEIIKPWLRGRDVKRWCIEWAELYVIFTYHGVDIARYPAVEAYLQQFKPALLKRATSANHEWYELQQPQTGFYAEFEKPKIVYMVFQVRPVFAFDDSGHYINNAIWMLPKEDLFLLAILNSPVGWYQITQNCTPLQNGYQLIWDYLRKIIVPHVSHDLRVNIEALVRELLALRGQGTRAAKLETEINQLIYQAYDLTTEEKYLIEGYPTIEEIQDAHPNKWLVVEVTDRDEETLTPLRGIVRYTCDDRGEAMEESKNLKGKITYVFYSGELLDDEVFFG